MGSIATPSSSSSKTTASNSQVGIGGNAGIVLGTINTNTGSNSGKVSSSSASSSKKSDTNGGSSTGAGKGVLSKQGSSSGAGASTGPTSTSSGNVAINIATLDAGAIQAGSETSLAALQLASKSISANTELAGSLASQAIQAGQNFAALSFAAQTANNVVDRVAQATLGGSGDFTGGTDSGTGSGAAAQPAPDNTIKILMVIGIGLSLAVLLRDK